jgi:hypothetical protein
MIKLEGFPLPPWADILGVGVIKLGETFIIAGRQTCSVGRSGASSFRSTPTMRCERHRRLAPPQ